VGDVAYTNEWPENTFVTTTTCSTTVALSLSVCVCVQGWEEIVDKAVTHMLKTTLAKSHRDQSNVSVAIQDTPLDNQRLKKHIALFCDRILKGGKLTRSDHQLKTADTPKQAGATQIIGQTEKNRQPRPEQQTRHSRKHKKPALPALAEDTLERHTEM
jgi:hypothetical protein